MITNNKRQEQSKIVEYMDLGETHYYTCILIKKTLNQQAVGKTSGKVYQSFDYYAFDKLKA